ncbi:rod-binding protein [Vibrio mediterranei]|uniref:rod-binding protein n=1 Tax=Vibrio mediterranei TaxID=689 RepID=UPI001EFCEA50|nr:rod-binding protein [Vibrio mediterranei]MCG9623341.1 rod-binding protein [Vibrio mediterranei]
MLDSNALFLITQLPSQVPFTVKQQCEIKPGVENVASTKADVSVVASSLNSPSPAQAQTASFETLMVESSQRAGLATFSEQRSVPAHMQASQHVANFYLDNHALARMKHDNSGAGLLAASQQFEALFLQQMLTRMRSASEAMSDENNPLSMKSDGMFQGMLDAQLAQRISRQSSFGLAEMIFKQLSSQVPNRPLDKESK